MRGEQHADEPGPEGAEGIGRELGAGHVHAHGFAGDFVFTQGHPGAADARVLEAVDDEDGQRHERDDDVVAVHRLHAAVELHAEEVRAGDVGDAGGAAEDRVPVFEHDLGDRAEAERDDGEVVAAQAQDRKAEQQTEKHAHDAAERQADPETKVEMLVQQGVGVGANGEEGDITEIEQTGEADGDVEPEAKHDEDQRADHDVDVVEVLRARHQPREEHGEHADADQRPAAEHRVVRKALQQRVLAGFRVGVGDHFSAAVGPALDRELPKPGDDEGADADPDDVGPAPFDFAIDGVDPHDHQRQRQEHEP